MAMTPPDVTELSEPRERGRLSGQMNTTKLVLSVLAFSSPLTCIAGYFSLTIKSVGETAPVAFVIVMALLLVFAVGYMAMTRHMPRPGAFYAYISEGLGRPLGLSSAFLAAVSYTAICMGVYCFAGVTLSGLVTQFGGPEIPWWSGALVIWLIASVLGFLNVDVSARVLMYVMAVEVAVVLIFDVAVASHGGASGLSAEPFDVGGFFGRHGDAAVGMLFAMLVFIGFEATALYRDEVEQPSRTIPRATYIAIMFIGLLYTATVWMMVSAFGDSAEQVANDDSAGMFGTAADKFVGPWFTDAATVLLITAVLAAVLSIHNAATRYVFNLGSDGALPLALGAVHGRHRSPYLASTVISIVSLVGVVPYAIADSDPSAVYSQLAGLGNAGVLILMALVSVSVIVWFRRHGRAHGEGSFATVYAPVVASIAMTTLVVYALSNFDLVTGSTGLVNWMLIAVLVIALAAGLGRALYLRGRDRRTYAALGGALND